MKFIHPILVCLFLLLPCVLAGCVNRQVAVTETYQETQYRTETSTEPVTENQTIVHGETGEFNVTPYYNWTVGNFYYLGYEIPDSQSYDNITLRLSIWPQLQTESIELRVFDVSKTGQIPSPEPLPAEEEAPKIPKWYLITGVASSSWLLEANTIISHSKFLGATNYGFSKRTDPQIILLDAGRASSIAIVIFGPQFKWNCRVTVDVLWQRNTYEYQMVTRQRQVYRQVPYQVDRQRTVFQTRQVPFLQAIFSP